MFPNIQMVKEILKTSEFDEKILNSQEAPIVILELKNLKQQFLSKFVAPDLNRIGAILSYSAHHLLILKYFAKPIIFTSANLSGEPLIDNFEELKSKLNELDFILDFDRDIFNSVDDSLVLPLNSSEKLILRLGRGFAPKVLKYPNNSKNRDKKIIFKEEKHFFGMFKTITGSPYHNIDYTNKNIYNGKICMGCHQHKENSHQFKICDVSNSGANNETKNCITCHMPKVQGTATTIKITKQHTFHGFSGARFNYKMLAKYIKIDLKKVDDGFDLLITNEAPHNFLLHPLRVAMLKISVDGKNLQPRAFVRILGKNNKPAMPWVATGLFKNNMIKANETRTIHYKYSLKEHSNIKVKFGYFLVNPKMIKKLGLQINKSIQEFKIIKNKYFTL